LTIKGADPLKKNYKFIVQGKVQGVYYRVSVQKNALNSGYSGYVKNKLDGSVEAGVSCDESSLDGFLQILQKGSTNSKVTTIEKSKCTEIFSGDFEIR